MIRFELPDLARVHICNVNPRREKHGDENKPAIDIKLRLDASNQVLGMFDPKLKGALYFRSGGQGAQAQIEGTEHTDLPNVAFPALGPLKWDLELTGYTLKIDHGMGGKSDLVIPECKLAKFTLEPKEGGTVVVTFRAQSNHCGERETGKLCTLIDSDVELTLVGPEIADAQKKIDDQAGGADGKPGEKGAGGVVSEKDWPFPKGQDQTTPGAAAELQRRINAGETEPGAVAAKRIAKKAREAKGAAQ